MPAASKQSSPPSTSERNDFRPKFARYFTAILLFLAVSIGGYLGFYRYHLKRFQAVAPGVLYRVAQPTELGIEILARLYNVKTLVSLQLMDFRLHRGLFDPGAADGRIESEYARTAGLNPVQWPMGVEQSWPWPTPWQFEEFFRLVDDPRNHPIVIHCMGGRHRTGTLSALYRLEYDRWPIERALAEMYSFRFGGAIPAQEHNLRTYAPRPRPSDSEWLVLREQFGAVLSPLPSDYEAFVRRLREAGADQSLQSALAGYLSKDNPFRLPLAERLIDDPSHPLAETATNLALRTLNMENADEASLASAASLIADYGSTDQQSRLSAALASETTSPAPSARYEALVRGVTNRYTRNRIPFLKPLLTDLRTRRDPALAKYRYCDTALYRLAAITDDLEILNWTDELERELGPAAALAWFAAHSEAERLVKFIRPTPTLVVQQSDGTEQEDLSRMRR